MKVRTTLFNPKLKQTSMMLLETPQTGTGIEKISLGIDVKYLFRFLEHTYGEVAPVIGGTAVITVEDGDEEAIYSMHYQVLYAILRERIGTRLLGIGDFDIIFNADNYANAKAKAADYEGGLRRALR